MRPLHANECGGKVSDKAASCPHCGAPITRSDAANAAPPQPKRTDLSGWYVAVPGTDPIGPVTTDHVVRGWLAGRIPAGAKVRSDGDARWSEPTEVPELAAALMVANDARTSAAKATPKPSNKKYVWWVIGGAVVMMLVAGLAIARPCALGWRTKNPYPQQVIDDFMRGCVPESSVGRCECAIDTIQRNYTYQQFDDISKYRGLPEIDMKNMVNAKCSGVR